MKKFFTILSFCLIIFASCFAFSGCGSYESEFWVKSYLELQKNVSKMTEVITYSETVTNKISDADSDFSDIALIYEPMLSESLSFITSTYQDYMVYDPKIPDKQLNNASKLFKKFDESLSDFVIANTAFLNQKERFEEVCEDFESAGIVEARALEDFERQFTSYIGACVKLNTTYSEAILYTYFGMPSSAKDINKDTIVSMTNSLIVSTRMKTLQAKFDYAFNYDGRYNSQIGEYHLETTEIAFLTELDVAGKSSEEIAELHGAQYDQFFELQSLFDDSKEQMTKMFKKKGEHFDYYYTLDGKENTLKVQRLSIKQLKAKNFVQNGAKTLLNVMNSLIVAIKS